MRTSEWINLIFLGVLGVWAWARPVTPARRMKCTLLGVGGIAAILLVNAAAHFFSHRSIEILRDWLPAPLLLFVYWQAGTLFVQPNLRVQRALEEFDRPVVRWVARLRTARWGRLLLRYLELSYMLCYAVVPFGLGALYWAGLRYHAEEYWVVVLLASNTCYFSVPLVSTLPPRTFSATPETSSAKFGLRGLNLWILRHASIQVNTFPSAHVAASLAVALVLLHFLPVAGWPFLALALSIAASAVAGRYHYALDAITGATVAVVFFLLLI